MGARGVGEMFMVTRDTVRVGGIERATEGTGGVRSVTGWMGGGRLSGS